MDSYGTLTIEQVRQDDAGIYICQASSPVGVALTRARLEVKQIDPRPPPIIDEGPQNQTLLINHEAMLRCRPRGDPQPVITWFKDGRRLNTDDSRLIQTTTGMLQISCERNSPYLIFIHED